MQAMMNGLGSGSQFGNFMQQQQQQAASLLAAQQVCILSTCRTIDSTLESLDKRAEFGKINKLPSRVIESTLRK